MEKERIEFRDDPASGATAVSAPCLRTRAAPHASYSRGMGLFSGSLYLKVRGGRARAGSRACDGGGLRVCGFTWRMRGPACAACCRSLVIKQSHATWWIHVHRIWCV